MIDGIRITLDLPDDVSDQLAVSGNPERSVLEAIALEGYRSESLSESQIRRLLGFETRPEVHAFLKAHGAYLHYTLDDLDQERELSHETRAKRERERNA
jgi:hypothetical protein